MWYVVYHVCLLVQTFVTVTCNKSWRSKIASLTAKLCVTIAMSLLYSPQYCLGRPSLTILSLFIHKAAWSKLCHRLICFASSNNQTCLGIFIINIIILLYCDFQQYCFQEIKILLKGRSWHACVHLIFVSSHMEIARSCPIVYCQLTA